MLGITDNVFLIQPNCVKKLLAEALKVDKSEKSDFSESNYLVAIVNSLPLQMFCQANVLKTKMFSLQKKNVDKKVVPPCSDEQSII